MPLNCTLQNGQNGKFYGIYILSQFKKTPDHECINLIRNNQHGNTVLMSCTLCLYHLGPWNSPDCTEGVIRSFKNLTLFTSQLTPLSKRLRIRPGLCKQCPSLLCISPSPQEPQPTANRTSTSFFSYFSCPRHHKKSQEITCQSV